jgi:phosphatidylserine decarboxylase
VLRGRREGDGVASTHDPWVGSATRLVDLLSPLDVHINRAPVAASVAGVEYQAGKFLRLQGGSVDVNERCTVTLAGPARVAVRADRPACWPGASCWRLRSGDTVQRGERYGLIRFGSRTDLLIPDASLVRVKVGDRVRGGETVMALLP